MDEMLFFIELAGFFGYVALGIGSVMIGVMVVFLFSSAPWSRWAGLVLPVAALLTGTAGWIEGHFQMNKALESMTPEGHEYAKQFSPQSTKTLDHLREEMRAVGNVEARYPFYLGAGVFLLGLVLWIPGEFVFRRRCRSSQDP